MLTCKRHEAVLLRGLERMEQRGHGVFLGAEPVLAQPDAGKRHRGIREIAEVLIGARRLEQELERGHKIGEVEVTAGEPVHRRGDERRIADRVRERARLLGERDRTLRVTGAGQFGPERVERTHAVRHIRGVGQRGFEGPDARLVVHRGEQDQRRRGRSSARCASAENGPVQWPGTSAWSCDCTGYRPKAPAARRPAASRRRRRRCAQLLRRGSARGSPPRGRRGASARRAAASRARNATSP